MIERYETLVPVDVTSSMSKGTVLEYDSTNHYYKPYSAGTPAGILMEDVSSGQDPAMAKVLFAGIVYEDEISGTVTEDLKAALRQVGIFIEKRETIL